MTDICSFSYTAWTLAVVYLVLFFLVIRYLLNLIKQNSVKKRAQKLFLCILIGQTTLRTVYFTVYPFSANSCEPSMKGNHGEDTSGAEWWMHLLSNVPAVLFLMAFSVLVFTFARIYHKVLLAGVWFQERRFRFLTVVLVILNLVALVATFGDWAYAASPNSHLQAFVNMLLYTILAVSSILAGFFLLYGTLLYYQVQTIIRASSENAAIGPTSTPHHHHHHHDYSYSNNNLHTPLKTAPMTTPSNGLLLPAHLSRSDLTGMNLTDGSTGFTPVHNKRRRGGVGASGIGQHQQQIDRDELEDSVEGQPSSMEGSYQPPVPAGGINLPPTSSGPMPKDSIYPFTGFASPNLPIQHSSKPNHQTSIAHSYVSQEGSFSPEQVVVGMAAVQADLLSIVPIIGPDGQPLPPNPSSATEKLKHEPVALAVQSPTGASTSGIVAANGVHVSNIAPSPQHRYTASSVSPEYGHVSNHGRRAGTMSSSGGGLVPTGSVPTPTDALIASTPYESHHTPKRTHGLAKTSYSTKRPFAHHSPPEDDEHDLSHHSLHHTARDLDDIHARDRQRAIRGLTNASMISNGYPAADATNTGMISPNITLIDHPHSHTIPLLPTAEQALPPNPMRKIAVIASICCMCLLVRTILIIVYSALSADFNWLTTLVYFAFSEVLPLLAMLKGESRRNNRSHHLDFDSLSYSLTRFAVCFTSCQFLILQPHSSMLLEPVEVGPVSSPSRHSVPYFSIFSLISFFL